MEHVVKSIAEQIECLARLTGAPESFVIQVRELFTRKGISLEEDAAPYLQALEEAFIREECIRAGIAGTGETAAPPPGEVGHVASGYARQAERLRRAQSGLRQRGAAPLGLDAASADPAAAPGVSPSFGLVTRREREVLPLVPGPDEVQ